MPRPERRRWWLERYRGPGRSASRPRGWIGRSDLGRWWIPDLEDVALWRLSQLHRARIARLDAELEQSITDNHALAAELSGDDWSPPVPALDDQVLPDEHDGDDFDDENDIPF